MTTVTAARILSAIFLLVSVAAPAAAQAPPAPQAEPGQVLRVFLECPDTNCDFDYLRTEITFVDWVRDRKDAGVHVIVTSLNTATGGREYTLRFIGLGPFESIDDVLTLIVRQNAPDAEIRRNLAQYLRLGLARYVARTPGAADLQITKRIASKEEPAKAPVAVKDPWNLWVLRADVSASGDGEESSSRINYETGLSANRTTEAWKFDFQGNLDYSENKFVLDEEDSSDVFVSVSRSAEFEGAVVKSLTGHWSAATGFTVSTSTFQNKDLTAEIAAGVEYDIFPYVEFTKRRWTLRYLVALNHFRYNEITVFQKLSETLGKHELEMQIDAKQPWGQVGSSFTFEQYLNDPSKYRLEADGELELRLFRGFSVNVNGDVSRIRDQIYLRAGRSTPEEILVRQRQLATGYSYEFSVGISYTFGSIYNNVVNPRFR